MGWSYQPVFTEQDGERSYSLCPPLFCFRQWRISRKFSLTMAAPGDRANTPTPNLTVPKRRSLV
jgi:hypothetical protein